MKYPVEQVGWVVIGLLLGGLIAFSVTTLAADPTVISSTVSSTVSSSSNTVSSNSTVTKGAATASSPSLTLTNSDICKSASVSGSIQTQVFGISTGGVVVRDEHCEKLKMSRAMNAIGLKTVAAGVLAQDPIAFKAMWHSGVYPPIAGKLGTEARELWILNPEKLPDGVELSDLLLEDEYLMRKQEAPRITAAEEVAPWEKDGYVGTCKEWTGSYYRSC
jgi:hypothetical protein